MGRAHQKSPAPRRLAVVAALAAGLGLVAAGCSAGQITQTDTQVAAVNGASGDVGAIAVRDAQLLFPAEHGKYEQGEDAPVAVLIANNGGDTDRLLSVTSDSSQPAEVTGDTELQPGSSILVEAGESGGSSSSSASASASTSASAGRTGSSAPSASASVTITTTPTGSTTTTPSSGSNAATTTEADSASKSNNVPTTTTKAPSSVEPTQPGVATIVLKGLSKELRPGQTILVTFLFEKAGELTLEVPIGATSEPRPAGESAGGGH